MARENDPLLTTQEVLEILGVTRNTFDKWRSSGRGPITYRLPNGKLRFKLSDVEEWFEGLALEDPETARRREARELLLKGKRLPLGLYGPPSQSQHIAQPP